MRNLRTKALILDDIGKQKESFPIYEHIIKNTKEMSDGILPAFMSNRNVFWGGLMMRYLTIFAV